MTIRKRVSVLSHTNRPLLIDSLLATITVFLTCGFFKLVVFNVSFLDPVHSVLHHLSDEFENHIHAVTPASDQAISPPICLVDLGDADRNEIATILTTVSRQQPRLVCLDVIFDKKNQPVSVQLQAALRRLSQADRLVMASWLTISGDSHHERAVLQQAELPFRVAPVGYTNFVAQDGDIIRRLLVRYGEASVGGPDTLSFAGQVMQQVNPASWQHLQPHLAHNTPLRILYQSDPNRFGRFTKQALLNTNAQLPAMRNAIVLVGSMAGLNDQYVAEDVHTVPLNGNTQMAGLEIHANVIAMLLQELYIRPVSAKWLWSLSFFFCWCFMALFMYWFKHHHLSFHLRFKVFQLGFAILVLLTAAALFYWAHYEIDVLPLLIPIALSVDMLYIYESFSANWLSRWLAGKNLSKIIRYQPYLTHDAHTAKVHKPATHQPDVPVV